MILLNSEIMQNKISLKFLIYLHFQDFLKYLGKIFSVIKKKKFFLEIEPYDIKKHGELSFFKVSDRFEEVERYWVDEPYAFIVILRDLEKGVNTYKVVEPALTEFEKDLLERIYEDLQEVLTLESVKFESASKDIILKKEALKLLNSYAIPLETASIYKILYYLNRSYIGYGKINALMKDQYIEDISCDGVNIPIFLYHRKYHNIPTNISFEEKELNSFIIKIVQRSGKHISLGEPMVNATLPDGSRLQATLGREVTTRGSSFTIRKFREYPLTPIDLIKFGTFSIEMMAYLWLAVENNKSMIFAGGTASGKTTSLNAISLFIPPLSKIVSIEDTRELTLYHDNWIAGVSRETTDRREKVIDMFDLLRAALRQRPEYIIVGEVRGKEAFTLFQAMSTGHTTYSTMHASDIQSAVNRLENEPINIPSVMLAALDLMCVQIQVYHRGIRKRRTKSIVEFTGIDPVHHTLQINEMFTWDPKTDTFKQSGDSHILKDIMHIHGWSQDELYEEFERRKKILKYMIDKNISDYKSFSEIVQSYFINPEKVMQNIKD